MHRASTGGEVPLWQWLLILSDGLPWSATARAGGWLVGGRLHQGIAGGVLLQEPGGQFLAEVTGQVFPLRERDQLILLLGVKHAIESRRSLCEPALAELFPVSGRKGGIGWHRYWLLAENT